jgi:hypothetical protein
MEIFVPAAFRARMSATVLLFLSIGAFLSSGYAAPSRLLRHGGCSVRALILCGLPAFQAYGSSAPWEIAAIARCEDIRRRYAQATVDYDAVDVQPGGLGHFGVWMDANPCNDQVEIHHRTIGQRDRRGVDGSDRGAGFDLDALGMAPLNDFRGLRRQAAAENVRARLDNSNLRACPPRGRGRFEADEPSANIPTRVPPRMSRVMRLASSWVRRVWHSPMLG